MIATAEANEKNTMQIAEAEWKGAASIRSNMELAFTCTVGWSAARRILEPDSNRNPEAEVRAHSSFKY
jgi:hypothetical protein